MAKRFSNIGFRMIVTLLVLFVAAAAAAAAVEGPASPAPAAPPVAGCLAASPVNALDGLSPVAPSWMQRTPVPCGPGCPAIGAGTDPSCTGKKTGDACGSAGGFCLQVLSPTCPKSAAQCSCYAR
jgi:hypothetical protein